MIDPFLERTENIQNKKLKKFSGKMVVETRIQKVSEDERAMFYVDIYPDHALDENRAERRTEGNSYGT